MISFPLQTPFYFTSDIPGLITHYNFTFSAGSTTVPVNQSVYNSGNDYEYKAKVPTSVCPPSMDISITVSAANRLGQGPPSQPYLFGMKLCCVYIICIKYNHGIGQCHKNM